MTVHRTGPNGGWGREGRDRGTVLIVVNDSWLQAFLSDVLTREGYRIMQTRNAADGILLAREHRPDIILLDFVRPGKGGLALLHELKARAATCAIPVILLSDSARPHLPRQARRAGVGPSAKGAGSPPALARTRRRSLCRAPTTCGAMSSILPDTRPASSTFSGGRSSGEPYPCNS
jgi:CheY-like chemotaxis protein